MFRRPYNCASMKPRQSVVHLVRPPIDVETRWSRSAQKGTRQ